MEWNNTDGTKNKSITMLAEASDKPFICVATNIPGYGNNLRNASLFVIAPRHGTTEDTTIAISTTQSSGHLNRNLREFILIFTFCRK